MQGGDIVFYGMAVYGLAFILAGLKQSGGKHSVGPFEIIKLLWQGKIKNVK